MVLGEVDVDECEIDERDLPGLGRVDDGAERRLKFAEPVFGHGGLDVLFAAEVAIGRGLRDPDPARDGAQRERLSLLEHLDPRRHEGGAEIAVVVTWLLGGRR